MITSSGVICDVCGHYILPLDPSERVNCFGVKGIEQELHCDNKCKELVLGIGRDWTRLPKEGRLYKVFQEYNDEKGK